MSNLDNKSVSEIESKYHCKIDDIFNIMKEKDISLAQAFKELNLINKSKAKTYLYEGKEYTSLGIIKNFVRIKVNLDIEEIQDIYNSNIKLKEIYKTIDEYIERVKDIKTKASISSKNYSFKNYYKQGCSINVCILLLHDDLCFNNQIGTFKELCKNNNINFSKAKKELIKTGNYEKALNNCINGSCNN